MVHEVKSFGSKDVYGGVSGRDRESLVGFEERVFGVLRAVCGGSGPVQVV